MSKTITQEQLNSLIEERAKDLAKQIVEKLNEQKEDVKEEPKVESEDIQIIEPDYKTKYEELLLKTKEDLTKVTPTKVPNPQISKDIYDNILEGLK